MRKKQNCCPTLQQQLASMLANCWQQIELVLTLANFFRVDKLAFDMWTIATTSVHRISFSKVFSYEITNVLKFANTSLPRVCRVTEPLWPWLLCRGGLDYWKGKGIWFIPHPSPNPAPLSFYSHPLLFFFLPCPFPSPPPPPLGYYFVLSIELVRLLLATHSPCFTTTPVTQANWTKNHFLFWWISFLSAANDSKPTLFTTQ